jgi:hypothetical protein
MSDTFENTKIESINYQRALIITNNFKSALVGKEIRERFIQ